MINERNPEQKKKEAVDYFKKAIEWVEGETNKQKIALTLHTLLVSLDRESEIIDYKQYLPEGTVNDENLE